MDCTLITWWGSGGGGWEMVEICPKTKSYPPLIKQKLILTPPHIMIILSLQELVEICTLLLPKKKANHFTFI